MGQGGLCNRQDDLGRGEASLATGGSPAGNLPRGTKRISRKSLGCGAEDLLGLSCRTETAPAGNRIWQSTIQARAALLRSSSSEGHGLGMDPHSPGGPRILLLVSQAEPARNR